MTAVMQKVGEGDVQSVFSGCTFQINADIFINLKKGTDGRGGCGGFISH